jgi:hypothetical protein
MTVLCDPATVRFCRLIGWCSLSRRSPMCFELPASAVFSAAADDVSALAAAQFAAHAQSRC